MAVVMVEVVYKHRVYQDFNVVLSEQVKRELKSSEIDCLYWRVAHNVWIVGTVMVKIEQEACSSFALRLFLSQCAVLKCVSPRFSLVRVCVEG